MGEPIVNDATVKRDWFGQPRGLTILLLTGNILAVRADQRIDRSVTSTWLMPMTWFQAINPLVIFVLTPWIVLRWKKQATVGREWGATTKMVFGSVVIAASYFTSRNKAHDHANRHADAGVSVNEQQHVAFWQQVTRQ
jgi:dipeptide/tripeptide permease